MNYKIEKENSHYLMALKNLDIYDLEKYLINEGFESFIYTEHFRKIKENSKIFSILESIYVKPENRNQGLAKSMMLKYLKEVKANTYILLADITSDTDTFSIEDFYKEFGYKTIFYDCFALMKKKG